MTTCFFKQSIELILFLLSDHAREVFKERVNSVASIRAEKVGVSECVCVSECECVCECVYEREREREREREERE